MKRFFFLSSNKNIVLIIRLFLYLKIVKKHVMQNTGQDLLISLFIRKIWTIFVYMCVCVPIDGTIKKAKKEISIEPFESLVSNELYVTTGWMRA